MPLDKKLHNKKSLGRFFAKISKNIPNQGVFVVQKLNFYAEIPFFSKNMLQFYAGCVTIHTQMHKYICFIYIT